MRKSEILAATQQRPLSLLDAYALPSKAARGAAMLAGFRDRREDGRRGGNELARVRTEPPEQSRYPLPLPTFRIFR